MVNLHDDASQQTSKQMKERQTGVIHAASTVLLNYLYLPFNYRIILLNRKYSHIGRFGIEAVRENDVVELIAFGPLDITAGRVRLGFGGGVVVGIHFAVVVVDIVGDMQEVFRANL